MTTNREAVERRSSELAAPPHPSRVTASGGGHVTGVLPMCLSCPLAEGHDGEHLTQADVEGAYVLDRAAPNGYRVA